MNNPGSSLKPSSLIIIGVGRGGCNTVQTIARQWTNGPKIVGIHTDRRPSAEAKTIEFIPIGEKILKGLGTGGDPRLARQAAEADIEKLRPLFNGVDFVIFAVGLGGGTGSGVAPLLITEAKKAGALTLCFVMLPFEFEGPRRKEQAERGLQAIRDAADGVICLPSQRLAALMEDKANIREAFRRAETMLAAGIQEFWRVLNRSSIINFNFADLRAFLQNSNGNCIFCCAEGGGERRIEMVLDGIKRHALFNHGRTLADADSFVICIIGGADLSIGDINGVVQGILAFGNRKALVMTGVGCEPEWRAKIHVTILAAEKRLPNAQPAPADREHARRDINHGLNVIKPRPRSKDSESGQPGLIQTGLFDALEQGRFKGVSPTIVDGSNLDIPTFIRRRIPIQKATITNN